jgi:hypothetical protein
VAVKTGASLIAPDRLDIEAASRFVINSDLFSWVKTGNRATTAGYWSATARGRTSDRTVGTIHDLVQSPFDLGLVGLANLAEDISYLASPAALHGDAMQCVRQGGQQA